MTDKELIKRGCRYEMKSNIEFLYEELRQATDGGSESMTHDDALKQIHYWRDQAAQAQATAEPVAYLAWRDGNPCYEGDDAVCEDAVWPADEDDERTSMPVYTAPPDYERMSALADKWNMECDEMREDNKRLAALLQQAVEALELNVTYAGERNLDALARAAMAIEAIKELQE